MLNGILPFFSSSLHRHNRPASNMRPRLSNMRIARYLMWLLAAFISHATASSSHAIATSSPSSSPAVSYTQCLEVLASGYLDHATAKQACQELVLAASTAAAAAAASSAIVDFEKDPISFLGEGEAVHDVPTTSASSEAKAEKGKEAGREENGFSHFDTTQDMINLGLSIFCIVTAAITSGVCIGFLGIEPLELDIKLRAGTPLEIKQAKAVLPLVRMHHQLICTLLFTSSTCTEALPLFLDKLVPSWCAVLLSVTLVLMFCEIIPSGLVALFSGPGKIDLAARLSPLVWLLVILLWPIAWPASKLLDCIFGSHDEDKRYNRGELSALIQIHHNNQRKKQAAGLILPSSMARGLLAAPTPAVIRHQSSLDRLVQGGGKDIEKGGGRYGSVVASSSALSAVLGDDQWGRSKDHLLTDHEVNVVVGMLNIASKMVGERYTPWSRVFRLSTDDVLNQEKIEAIRVSGYSRIPVYEGNDQTLLKGYFLAKRLISIRPEEQLKVGSIPLRQPLVVSPECSLIDLLNTFRSWQAHLALVSIDPPKPWTGSIDQGRPIDPNASPMGIITIQDVVEVILQERMPDEDQDLDAEHELQAPSSAAGAGGGSTSNNSNSKEDEKAPFLPAFQRQGTSESSILNAATGGRPPSLRPGLVAVPSSIAGRG